MYNSRPLNYSALECEERVVNRLCFIKKWKTFHTWLALYKHEYPSVVCFPSIDQLIPISIKNYVSKVSIPVPLKHSSYPLYVIKKITEVNGQISRYRAANIPLSSTSIPSLFLLLNRWRSFLMMNKQRSRKIQYIIRLKYHRMKSYNLAKWIHRHLQVVRECKTESFGNNWYISIILLRTFSSLRNRLLMSYRINMNRIESHHQIYLKRKGLQLFQWRLCNGRRIVKWSSVCVQRIRKLWTRMSWGKWVTYIERERNHRRRDDEINTTVFRHYLKRKFLRFIKQIKFSSLKIIQLLKRGELFCRRYRLMKGMVGLQRGNVINKSIWAVTYLSVYFNKYVILKKAMLKFRSKRSQVKIEPKDKVNVRSSIL